MGLVGQAERGEIEQDVALASLGPVDDPAVLVTVDEDVLDVQVAADEGRRPRSRHLLGVSLIPLHDLQREDGVLDEPATLIGEA